MKISRRQFAKLAAASPAITHMHSLKSEARSGSLTDIKGVRVGHYTDSRRPTGCTVVLVEEGAVAGVDVRGSAPGTRETDLLDPINTVQKVHAVLLSGGSAFGLEAAGGVVQYLEERGIGFETRAGKVPIVPAAILFDLGVGDSTIRPDRQAGYRACQNATADPIEEGNVGAGAGATVGKLFGADRGMKGGLGTAGLKVGDVIVAALVAVNAVGDVMDPKTGKILAGARTEDGKTFANTVEILKTTPVVPRVRPLESTTLGIVATNAVFDKVGMTKIAQMARAGFARTINPVHLPMDGDAIFALSTGEVKGADLGRVGALAAEVTAQAIVRAILKARGIPGFPSHSDLIKDS